MLNIYWDLEYCQKDLIINANTVENNNGGILQLNNLIQIKKELRLAIIPKSLAQQSQISFYIDEINEKFQIMIGVADRKMRKQRGLFFQDTVYYGHGIYGLMSTKEKSYTFSNHILEKNYQEGGFQFTPKSFVNLKFDDKKLIICDEFNCTQLDVDIEDKHLYFCVAIAHGVVKVI